jgi:glutamate-1-semialdehyde 2,1-aminomutase
MFGFFLQPKLAQNYQEAVKTDSAVFAKFYHGMLDRGVYFAPALYEAGFVSSAHTQADLDETFAAAREVFAQLG